MAKPPKIPGRAPANAETDGIDGYAAGFASPPCLACEIDAHYFDPPQPLPQPDLIERLNRLLEAERGGVKAVAALAGNASLASLHAELAAIGRDAARYAAMLDETIQMLGGGARSASGDSLSQALPIEDVAEQLRFLNHGQNRVVRQLTESLPRIEDAELRARLSEMHRTHIENIQRCDALIAALDPEP